MCFAAPFGVSLGGRNGRNVSCTALCNRGERTGAPFGTLDIAARLAGVVGFVQSAAEAIRTVYCWIVYNCYMGWLDVVLAVLEAKASVFCRTAAAPQPKGSSLWQNGYHCHIGPPLHLLARAVHAVELCVVRVLKAQRQSRGDQGHVPLDSLKLLYRLSNSELSARQRVWLSHEGSGSRRQRHCRFLRLSAPRAVEAQAKRRQQAVTSFRWAQSRGDQCHVPLDSLQLLHRLGRCCRPSPPSGGPTARR